MQSGVRILILVTGAIVLFNVIAFPQTQTTGSISGFVRDQSSAVIPGVAIKAEQEGTGLTRSSISTETGAYTVGLLPPGRYTVTLTLPGFQTLVNKDIVINATERVTFNASLRVADIDTIVEVSATAQLVQTESTTLGRVIDERLTTQLPLPTKNYTQLLALSPGTLADVPDTAGVGRGTINISANGASTNSNAFMLDGVDSNNIHTNQAAENSLASNGVPIPSTEVIREFKVQSGLYDAQYGRNAGSNINVVTKSGTNELHGVFYHYLRNNVLNANSFFFNRTGTPRPVMRQNQFGATVGGPIRRDKTFFFIGYQGTRQVNGADARRSSSSLALPPIPQGRTRATLGQIFGGQAGRNGGVAIAQDGSNINPVALALLNARLANGDYVIPSPQISGSGVNYSVSIPARYDENQFTLNLDHDFAQNHKASLRMFGANLPQTVAMPLGNAIPGFPLTQDFKNRNMSITYTFTVTPRIVNEARAGYNRPAGVTIYQTPVTAAQLGMNRFNLDQIPDMPQIQISGVFTMGYDQNVPQQTIPNIYTYQDTLSFTHGSHFMRAGVEYRRHSTNLYNNWNWRGTLSFLSFPDFLLGMPGGPDGNGTAFSNIQSVTVGAGKTYRHFRAADYVGYFQDDWKISPQLTLNLGVRYDFLGAISDRFGEMGNFDPRKYVAPPPGGQTSTGFVLPENTRTPIEGFPLVSKTLQDQAQKKNWSPRLGVAFRPFADKSLVVRAGYGIFYDRVSNNLTLQTLVSPPFFTLFSDSGAAVSFASFQNPFPNLPRNEEHPVKTVIYGPPHDATRRLVSVFSLSPELRTPYLQHYTLNVQHEVARNLLLEVGYVGSKGTHLRLTPIINQPLLASPERPVNGITTNTAANAAQRVPYIGFSPTNLTQVRTDADSIYNSLQTSLTKRLSHGLQFLSSYTWAHSLDTTSTTGDQTNRRGSRGPSSFDRKHRFVFAYFYQIPAWGFGLNDSGFGSRFFTGWQISGVTTLQSGSAFSITDSTGGRFFGSTNSTASYAPGHTSKTATLSGPTQARLDKYFDTSAFVRAGDLFGNIGMRTMRGPSQSNLDVALVKSTSFLENKSLEWRMEVFNALNHANFANPSGSITSSAFGTITATVSNARLIQFGLRFVY